MLSFSVPKNGEIMVSSVSATSMSVAPHELVNIEDLLIQATTDVHYNNLSRTCVLHKDLFSRMAYAIACIELRKDDAAIHAQLLVLDNKQPTVAEYIRVYESAGETKLLNHFQRLLTLMQSVQALD